jgi:MFS family permease
MRMLHFCLLKPSTMFLQHYFLISVFQAYATEVCRKEHGHLGLSLVSSSRGIGLIVGPAIGGYLAQVIFYFNI